MGEGSVLDHGSSMAPSTAFINMGREAVDALNRVHAATIKESRMETLPDALQDIFFTMFLRTIELTIIHYVEYKRIDYDSSLLNVNISDEVTDEFYDNGDILEELLDMPDSGASQEAFDAIMGDVDCESVNIQDDVIANIVNYMLIALPVPDDLGDFIHYIVTNNDSRTFTDRNPAFKHTGNYQITLNQSANVIVVEYKA